MRHSLTVWSTIHFMSDLSPTPSGEPDATSHPPEALERLVRSRWYGPGGIAGLSKLSGVSRATLYAWFRGETVPDTKSLARLAAVLEMPLAELVGTVQAEPGPLRMVAAPTQAREMPIPRSPLPSSRSATIGRSVSGQGVFSCTADDPIGPVARTLYERHFSQVPVRDGDRWIGLLTTEAIARWMAGRSRNELGVQDAAPVREVLAYADDQGDFRIVPATAPVTQVIGLFDATTAQGQPLKALLVVDAADEGILEGIVTAYDLSRLRSMTGR
jgi:CBS domain-containing protein